MFTNYLKICLRNLQRRKIFSIINIIGFSIGMAASLLIALWVADELSYDKYNANYDNVYRVERKLNFEGKIYNIPVVAAKFSPTLLADYPQIKKATRIYPQEVSVQDYRKNYHNERVFFVDNSFFDIFSFPLLSGNTSTALSDPNQIVLTREAAQKYFGAKNPINQTLQININDTLLTFKVSGIINDCPQNSHFHFSVLASFSSLEPLRREQFRTYISNYLYTYILVKDKATAKNLESRFPGFIKKYLAPEIIAVVGNKFNIPEAFQLKLRPLSELHLHSNVAFDIEPQGNITVVYVFSGIALVILLMACFNFINLSTAIGGQRAREVGIRKTIGATKYNLVFQFTGESVLIVLFAFVLSLGIAEILLPVFNLLSQKTLTWLVFLQPSNLVYVIAFVFITGIVAGLYPAFYLAKFKPIEVLKGNRITENRRFSFRQILVVFQFIISVSLIIAMLTAFLQMRFFQEKKLGFDKENQMVIPIENNLITTHYETFRNLLLSNTDIENVTVSSNSLAKSDYSDSSFKGEISDDDLQSAFMFTDSHFLECYKIKLIAGNNFTQSKAEINRAYILNETAVKKLGYKFPEQAVGKRFRALVGMPEDGKIVGVVKDFHFRNLKKKIDAFILINNDENISFLTINISDRNKQQTVADIQRSWQKMFPDVVFNYYFLDDKYKEQYLAEYHIQNILISFSILAIFIACLGLFGLAAFSAQLKTKEIGIRKVHGASLINIIHLISKEFTILVLVAMVVAWPLAYYCLNRWLENFAYRIAMPYVVFIIASVLCFIVAFIAISFQAVKSANANPVESLKYE